MLRAVPLIELFQHVKGFWGANTSERGGVPGAPAVPATGAATPGHLAPAVVAISGRNPLDAPTVASAACVRRSGWRVVRRADGVGVFFTSSYLSGPYAQNVRGDRD